MVSICPLTTVNHSVLFAQFCKRFLHQWNQNTDMPVNMNTFDAVGIAEGFIEADSQEQVIEAWQYLIDTGLAWKLQGWFGRTASHLIGEGICQEPQRGG